MDISVTGGTYLKGNVTCSGAKNAAIPLICASLLAKGKVLLRNVPRISDVFDICQIVRYLDCKVIFKGHTMLIDNANLKYKPLFYEECKRIRGSYYFIGVFLALFSKCEIWLPGGCKIGARPIDVHLQAFLDLGFKYNLDGNVLTVYKTSAIEEANIQLSKKSVGASLNAMFASIALSRVAITNVLLEPEGLDVLEFLKKIGYNILYTNSQFLFEKTNLDFKLVKHTIVPDRIEALTYIVMGLLLGDVTVKKLRPNTMTFPLELLKQAGFALEVKENEVHAKKSFGKPMQIKTDCYPGFPTDLQSLFGVLFVNTLGKSEIEETIFENRMQIYFDLKASGIDCVVTDNKATVVGSNKVQSRDYTASDLRHGVAILILAMLGDEKSKISNVEYVLRGYDDIKNRVKALGAKITIL